MTSSLPAAPPSPATQRPAAPALSQRGRGFVVSATRWGSRTLALAYLSLIVLIPVAALATHALDHGLGVWWNAVSQRESLSALRLTITCAAAAAVVNTIAGTATAWVLARDHFVGSAALNAIIDLPFALPTVVAGVTFYTLYGPHSPLKINVTGTWIGVTLAIMFVTLPFNVRSVQPVLEARSFSAESAAATLGASPLRVFFTITLPALLPAILAGAGLSFARALGEYGSVVFISNNLPYRSEVASSYVYSLATSGQVDAAAAVSLALLVLALVVLGAADLTSRRVSRGLS